jgi:Fic family protein
MIRTSTLAITPEMLRLVAEIDEFKGAWRSLGTLAPERLLALRRVATIESVGSSTRLEGAKLTDAQVEQLLGNIAIGSFASRDEQEVAGYAAVMETVFAHWSDLDITANHVRQLHRDLLIHSHKDVRHRGNWKTSGNSVAAFDTDGRQIGIVFETASPFDTPRLMDELLAWYGEEEAARQAGRGLHPLLVIAIVVVVFLEIHPFQDGNGRLSRVLTTLLLLRAGYDYVSYASLEAVIEQNKEAYYLALRQTQGTIRTEAPNWTPWLDFFLKSMQAQMRRLKQKVETERLLAAAMPELSLKLYELVRDQGRLTVAEAARATGESRNTIKKHLQGLVQTGRLELNGAGRGAWYSRRA